MRLTLLASLVLTVLVAGTGCATSGVGQPASALGATRDSEMVDTASDSLWTPPEEVSFTVVETKATPNRVVLGTVSGLPTPNRREVARGQVHEAY